MERFSNDLELAVYRIVQEGLRNVEKHARASEAFVELNWDQEFVNLRVRDNGRGLAEPDALEPERQRVRMGLVDMRERCEFLGGSFVVRFQADLGTEIAVRIPRNMGRGSRVS
jgi:signal transduction histidine kinase